MLFELRLGLGESLQLLLRRLCSLLILLHLRLVFLELLLIHLQVVARARAVRGSSLCARGVALRFLLRFLVLGELLVVLGPRRGSSVHGERARVACGSTDGHGSAVAARSEPRLLSWATTCTAPTEARDGEQLRVNRRKYVTVTVRTATARQGSLCLVSARESGPSMRV